MAGENGNGTLALSKSESAALEKLETVIGAGLSAFVQVGAALRQIREGRLYRSEYESFEAYCHERWKFSRQRAYQFIDAADVAGSFPATATANGDDADPNTAPKIFGAPATESHARALKDVPAELRPEVWKEAVETAPTNGNGQPKVTAAHVRRVAQESIAGEGEGEASPHAAFNEGIDQIAGALQNAATLMRGTFQSAGQELANRYAQKSFNYLTTIADVNRLRRDILDGRVVEERPDGTIVTERDVRVAKQSKGGRAA